MASSFGTSSTLRKIVPDLCIFRHTRARSWKPTPPAVPCACTYSLFATVLQNGHVALPEADPAAGSNPISRSAAVSTNSNLACFSFLGATILSATYCPFFFWSQVCLRSGTVAPQLGFLHLSVRVQR